MCARKVRKGVRNGGAQWGSLGVCARGTCRRMHSWGAQGGGAREVRGVVYKTPPPTHAHTPKCSM